MHFDPDGVEVATSFTEIAGIYMHAERYRYTDLLFLVRGKKQNNKKFASINIISGSYVGKHGSKFSNY